MANLVNFLRLQNPTVFGSSLIPPEGEDEFEDLEETWERVSTISSLVKTVKDDRGAAADFSTKQPRQCAPLRRPHRSSPLNLRKSPVQQLRRSPSPTSSLASSRTRFVHSPKTFLHPQEIPESPRQYRYPRTSSIAPGQTSSRHQEYFDDISEIAGPACRGRGGGGYDFDTSSVASSYQMPRGRLEADDRGKLIRPNPGFNETMDPFERVNRGLRNMNIRHEPEKPYKSPFTP